MSEAAPEKSGILAQNSFTPALVLLGVVIVINYVDRGSLSIAAPALKEELHLSATQLGRLFSAFFYTYTALQFVIGGIVDRFGANLVLSVGLLVWSLATIGTGFAGGFAALLILRLLLGIGESVAFPCSSKLISQHVQPENRGVANGIVTAGLKFGPAVGAFVSGLLIAKYGWRPVFWGLGAASLLWLPAWMAWKPSAPARPERDGARIGDAEILAKRDFWACAAGHFSFNYLSYFFLTWLPYYLAHERHLSEAALARAAGAYYLLDSLSALLTGWVTDLCVKNGIRASLVRKTASAIGHVTAAVAMIASAFASNEAYFPWLLVAAIGSGMAGCGVFLFAQALAGPRAIGRWSALQNGFGNFAGLTAPALTGFLVDRTGNFFAAFVLAAGISLAGAVIWSLAVRFTPVIWRENYETAAPET
jgi:ACS family D-galactonate transporter-like MFS transporter